MCLAEYRDGSSNKTNVSSLSNSENPTSYEQRHWTFTWSQDSSKSKVGFAQPEACGAQAGDKGEKPTGGGLCSSGNPLASDFYMVLETFHVALNSTVTKMVRKHEV